MQARFERTPYKYYAQVFYGGALKKHEARRSIKRYCLSSADAAYQESLHGTSTPTVQRFNGSTVQVMTPTSQPNGKITYSNYGSCVGLRSVCMPSTTQQQPIYITYKHQTKLILTHIVRHSNAEGCIIKIYIERPTDYNWYNQKFIHGE